MISEEKDDEETTELPAVRCPWYRRIIGGCQQAEAPETGDKGDETTGVKIPESIEAVHVALELEHEYQTLKEDNQLKNQCFSTY